jgi:microcystin-dependent protein
MAQPFLGEIRLVAFTFPPKGWAFCNGQLLSISQNAALFSILGTTYGGNGINNFALPNLQGSVPAHPGSSITLGQVGGAANVTLNSNQAGHSHVVSASASANANTAAGNFPGGSGTALYGSSPDTNMNAATIPTSGSSQPHNNMQPYLVLNYVIALTGIFPSRN